MSLVDSKDYIDSGFYFNGNNILEIETNHNSFRHIYADSEWIEIISKPKLNTYYFY